MLFVKGPISLQYKPKFAVVYVKYLTVHVGKIYYRDLSIPLPF